MPILQQLFHHLRWYEATEFVLLVLMVVAVPIYWQIGVWCLALLCTNTVVKTIATKHIGNTALTKPAKIGMWLMVAYLLLYVVSISYSNDKAEAWSMIWTMIPMLLLPSVFLASDMRYLRKDHYKVLVYGLASVLTARFLFLLLRASILSPLSHIINDSTDLFTLFVGQQTVLSNPGIASPYYSQLAIAIIQPIAALLQDSKILSLATFSFDGLHHNYLALYLLTAIALLYAETIRHWSDPCWRKARWAVLADIALLTAYLIVSGSRSGLVVLALLIAACCIHIIVTRKKWLLTALMLGGIAAIVSISFLCKSSMFKRAQTTVQRMLQGEEGDVRQTLWVCSLKTIRQHPVAGYGCEGYRTALYEQYHVMDCSSAYQQNLNPHNQYLETTLATGIIGLILMLAMMLWPLRAAWRSRNLSFLLFTLVYAGCIAFEATFGRQMGLLFIPLWYCLLLDDWQQQKLPPPAPVPHQPTTEL